MKTDKNKFLNFSFNLIGVLLPIFMVLAIFYFKEWSILLQIAVLGLSILCSIFAIFFKYNNRDSFKLFFIVNIFLIIIVWTYIFAEKFDFLKYISSPTVIKDFILSTGALGIFVFVLIQIAQVVCVPIPSVIIILVGTLIYGPTICALLCSIGVIAGSFISFGIGKSFGKKFVGWIVGKDKLQYYLGILNGREKLFLSIAFIFPLFPDDILCLISGISNITFKEFAKITFLTRPIGVICLCYFGGSFFTQFSSYKFVIIGLVVIIIVALLISLIVIKKKKLKVADEIKILVKSLSFKKNIINKGN